MHNAYVTSYIKKALIPFIMSDNKTGKINLLNDTYSMYKVDDLRLDQFPKNGFDLVTSISTPNGRPVVHLNRDTKEIILV